MSGGNEEDRRGKNTDGWFMWTGFVVFVEMRRGRLGEERERTGGARGRW